MALIVLDASVVIAHLDRDDALHVSATNALHEHKDDDLRLPASAYAEALVDPAGKGMLDQARAAFDALRVQIVPIDRRLAERAAGLRVRERRLRLPDALVLACGELLSADAILTADRRWRRYPRVHVLA
jgi:predicted nucleic acid-binding protein